MEFGNLEKFSDVDYSLKPASFYSSPFTQKSSFELYMGAPVWTHAEMIKSLKKGGGSGKTNLEVYSKSFNSIELNSSYYSIPSEVQISKWKEQVPDHFLFFPKAPKDLCFYAQKK